MKTTQPKGILTRAQKNANDKDWYKRKINELETFSRNSYDNNGVNERLKMKVNFDVFNNKIDLKEFDYVCNPYGENLGHNPAKMANRDIVSGKIKVIMGMQSKRPFKYRIIAVNPEATTAREQEEFGQIKQFVVNQIMLPIRQQIEMEKAQEMQGQELTPDQQQQIMQQVEEELQTRTPEEVKKYMAKEYQDPAETMTHQLLEYLYRKCDMEKIFNEAFKAGALSAKQVVYVGIANGEPKPFLVNNMRFNHDRSPDLMTIEEGEWATYEFRMSPSACISFFSRDLTKEQAERIYEYGASSASNSLDEMDLFRITDTIEGYESGNYISVRHGVWKHPRKIGFLTFINEAGEEEMTVVDEKYVMNKDFGDISIEWNYIPEVHECWKINLADPIYLRMGPVSGQHKDLDNLYECNLPYYGVVWDNMNSTETSLMDRLIDYQYLYNIINYRVENLLATDKGKKILMNIRLLPDSLRMSLKKWMHTSDNTPYVWFDPGEDAPDISAGSAATVLDLSLVSDIGKYLELMENVRLQAGKSVGITDNVEGQTAEREAVRNTQQNLVQSSYLLEPYFKLNDYFKINVLKALVETAKVAYASDKPRKLSYVMDDMSVAMFDLDVGLLDSSTLGFFIADSEELQRIKETIEQLAHAAMQNQRIELSDVISVLRQSSIIEAEETLKVAEVNRREAENQMQREQNEAQQAENEKQREREREQHQEDLEKIVVKEEERRKTEIVKSSLLGASFNPDLDKDKDGINDFIEIAKHGLDANIKQAKAQLERDEFEHKKQVDNKKLKQQDKKIANEEAKIKYQRKIAPK